MEYGFYPTWGLFEHLAYQTTIIRMAKKKVLSRVAGSHILLLGDQ
jgi:hypothetical protein